MKEEKKLIQITEYEGFFNGIDYQYDTGTDEPWVEDFKTMEEALAWAGWTGGKAKEAPGNTLVTFSCRNCGTVNSFKIDEGTQRILSSCSLCGQAIDRKTKDFILNERFKNFKYIDFEPTSRLVSECPGCGNLKEVPDPKPDPAGNWAVSFFNTNEYKYTCPVCNLEITVKNQRGHKEKGKEGTNDEV